MVIPIKGRGHLLETTIRSKGDVHSWVGYKIWTKLKKEEMHPLRAKVKEVEIIV
jgi:hypothetical protein